jgi:hypothetical protein
MPCTHRAAGVDQGDEQDLPGGGVEHGDLDDVAVQVGGLGVEDADAGRDPRLPFRRHRG